MTTKECVVFVDEKTDEILCIGSVNDVFTIV